MRIREKISLLVSAVVLGVLLVAAGQLALVEAGRVRVESGRRINALMEGVLRIARESLRANDELMLLSYLKFLMQEYPEIEIAVVSRQGYSSVMGEVKSELSYRSLTLTDGEAAAYKVSAFDVLKPSEAAGSAIPPSTFTIQLGFSRAAIERAIRSAQLALWSKILRTALVALLFGVAVAIWVGRLLARPVAELADAAERVGRGQLDARVTPRGEDEIADLARGFNDMTSRIRELVESKEDLMATLSHEMRTPLGGFRGFLEYLAESDADEDPAKRRDAYRTMIEAVSQMELSLGNALQLFRSGARATLRPERLELGAIVAEVIHLFTPAAQSNGITIAVRPSAAEAIVAADRELIRRVVVNLIANAIHYTPAGGSIEVTVGENSAGVALAVADTGPGISEEDRERIFDKFYRGRDLSGRRRRVPGSGLGLAIAKQAVDLHGGKIWVESAPGKGSTFHVALPKGEASLEPAKA